jgi:putative acetyltransferase
LLIKKGDLTDSRVVEMVRHHLATARAATAEGCAHALDIDALKSPDVSFWTVWEGDTLIGIGALKQLSAEHGELKSMHVAESARRKGAGAAMLRHLIQSAKQRGMTKVSLETGSWDYFMAARAFYRRNGFADCAPFAGYRLDPNSVFLALDLDRA